MPKQNTTSSPKPRFQFRHEQNIYDFVEKKRKLENRTESDFNKHVFNAGLKALYKVDIVNNEIVNR